MAGDFNHFIGKCEGAVTMYDPLRAKAKVVFYTALAFLFGLGIASGLGWTGVGNSMPVIESQPQIPESAVRPALDLSDAFVSIAEMVTPAVVRIETRRVALPLSERSLVRLPVTEGVRSDGILLPVEQGLTETQREHVLDTIFGYAIG